METILKKIISEVLDKQHEKELEEIVDEKGNIRTSKEPANTKTKGITQNKTTDQVAKTAYGQSGVNGSNGLRNTRLYGETDLTKTLGYKKTMGVDKDIKTAKKIFKKELKVDDETTKDKMDQMGYDEELPDDKVRLVEDPRKNLSEFIEQLLSKKQEVPDMIKNKSLPRFIERQLKTIKGHIADGSIDIYDVVKFLKNE